MSPALHAPERNAPCPCGSGKKYKKCCLGKTAPAPGPALQSAPNLTALYTQAVQHHSAGRLAEAEGLYRDILARDPDQPRALHGLGRLAYQFGHRAAALELLVRARPSLSPEPALHNDIGLAQLALGQVTEAVASFRDALALNPDYVEAHGNLANAYNKLGRVADACACLDRAIALRPGMAELHYNLGRVLAVQGRFDDALASYQRALTLKPDDVEILNGLGNICRDLRRYGEAVGYFERALALRPDYANTHNNLGNVLASQGRHAEALASYQRALILKPDDVEILNGLGNVCGDLHRYEEAVGYLQRALAIKPDYTNTYNNLGTVLQILRRYDEATGVYREWARREPGNPTAVHMLSALTESDMPTRASDAYVKETFNRFAGSFDSVLERLEYRAPALVAHVITSVLGTPRHRLTVLDAGCGTGLCGPHLREYAQRLVGVDLSPAMLAKARGRGVYDDLVEAELTSYLARAMDTYDLICSADTLCYFGTLEGVFAAAVGALRPDGHICFTVEEAQEEDAPAGMRLNLQGRYSHTHAYVLQTLAGAALTVVTLEAAVLRLESGKPVAGLVVMARRRSE